MPEVSIIHGQYQQPKALILVKETSQGVETGNFDGVTRDGKVLVRTPQNTNAVWAPEETKTINELVAAKNKKIGILSAFTIVQNEIIKKLTTLPVANDNCGCKNQNCCANTLDVQG